MNTQAIPYTPNSAVGQLAKIHFPTLKTVPAKDFEVGRHEEKNLHTLTHAGGTFDFSDQIPNKNRHFKLYKKAENDFMQTVPLLFDHLENTAVVFHNPDFVEEIYESYYTVHAHLFLDWVKAFALIRKAERTELMNGVIQSSDDDFLSALRLFKLQSIKPKQKRIMSQKEKVWQAIKQHFPDMPFGSRDIEDVTLIRCSTVNRFLCEFKEEGKLKQCRKRNNHKQYQLIKK